VTTAHEVQKSEGLNVTPIWFGPADRPLFGWLHLPEKATAGVVLCRPIGVEELSSHRAYRCLAEKLADHGMVALLFDYTGTGDSAGSTADVVGTRTWLADITTAIDCVRQTGVSRIGLVGLRLGATLAANAATANDVDALVLWDPCETGRGFLREQRMLAGSMRLRGVEVASRGDVEIPGLVLPKDLAEATRALSIDDSPMVPARPLLVLTRPDRPPSSSLLAWSSTQSLDQTEVVGQHEFIGVEPGASVLPEQVITDIEAWLSRRLSGTGDQSVCDHPQSMPTASVARTPDGRDVIERAVRIGAEHLFGVVTEPQVSGLGPTPAVVLVNAGVLPHSGPARLWVEIARSWAAQGVRVLRIDFGGLGDSPTRPGQRPDVVYPLEAIDEVTEAARFMDPDDPAGVLLVGLCSGGYHVLEGALRLNSQRVWIVNPGLPLAPPELIEGRGALDSRRQAVRPLNPLVRHLSAIDRIARLTVATTPAAAWWLFDKLRLYPSSAGALETLAGRGTEVLAVYAEPEFSRFAKRSRWAVRRLERSPHCHIEVVKSMDHSLFDFTGRAELIRLLTARLQDEFRLGVPG
jgi:dienelactone hydrolase